MSGAEWRQQQELEEAEMREQALRTRVQELFAYDPDTGHFRRLKTRGPGRKGSIAGTVTKRGYVRIRVDGGIYLAHRLAWLVVYGDFPIGDIDHINGNKGDNRINNLRKVTHSQNLQNVHRPYANTTSGAQGVSWHKATGKWQARIRVDGKNLYLGIFSDKDAAASAYRQAKAEHHIY